jgi:hypothetical protein
MPTKQTVSTTRKTIVLPVKTWKAVEAYQVAHDIPTITESISRLIRAGLKGARAPTVSAKKPPAVARKTVTLPDSIWATIDSFQDRHGLIRVADVFDPLVLAGLRLKIAVVSTRTTRTAL